VQDPAIEARVSSRSGDPLPLGTHVRAVLAEADPATRTVRFEV
jgi:hypothetical protein